MIFYVNLLLLLIYAKILKPKNNKNKRLFLILSGAQMILIAAFRHYTVGFDSEVYCKIFEMTAKRGILWQFYMEKGYLILNYVVARVFGNHYVYLWMVCSLLTVIPVLYYIYKYCEDVVLGVFIYVCFGYYYASMNTMRSGLAASLCLIAMNFHNEKKEWKALIMIILASTIHTSVIVFVMYIIFLLGSKRLDKKMMIRVILFATVIVFAFYNQISMVVMKFFSQYEVYFTDSNKRNIHLTGDLSAYFFLYFIICIILLKVRKSYNKNHSREEREINYNHIIALLISLAIMLFGARMHLVSRFSACFEILICCSLTNNINYIRKGKNKNIISGIIVVALLVINYYYLSIAENGLGRAGISPYYFFWQV